MLLEIGFLPEVMWIFDIFVYLERWYLAYVWNEEGDDGAYAALGVKH